MTSSRNASRTFTPSRYATEAFTWSSTCIISGVGVGNALGGRLLETSGPAATFALSAAIALVAALCALGTRVRPARGERLATSDDRAPR